MLKLIPLVRSIGSFTKGDVWLAPVHVLSMENPIIMLIIVEVDVVLGLKAKGYKVDKLKEGGECVD